MVVVVGDSPIFRRRYKQHDNVIFCFVFRFGVVLFVFKEREEEEEENASSDTVLTLTSILPFHFQRVLLATMGFFHYFFSDFFFFFSLPLFFRFVVCF